MPTRKHIQPGTKIGLKLTAIERKLILNDLIALDDNYANAIRNTPADQPVQFTLDDWDDLGGYIAAEANHTENKKLEKKLDAASRGCKRTDSHARSNPQPIAIVPPSSECLYDVGRN